MIAACRPKSRGSRPGSPPAAHPKAAPAAAPALFGLDGALDVDLTATPFTNTLPIRRLGLAAGRTAEILTVYVRVPELSVEADRQRYTCLEPMRRYRFESVDGDFTRDLEEDAHGLVVVYPGLFRRVA